jgi:phosphocarrier protein
MIVETVAITHPLGLHLRAAAQLARTASRFKCDIRLKNHNGCANGKSVINLISLAAVPGSEVTVVLEGKNAPEAWDAIHTLFTHRFDEAPPPLAAC